MQNSDVDDLWERFRSGEDEVKFLLMESYLPLVEGVARSAHRKLSQNVDVQDLINDGVFGLLDAIQRWDHSLGFKFETYAVARIRGEIYDKLRTQDWVPRSLRGVAKKVEKAIEILEQENKQPSVEAIAELADISVLEVEKIFSKVFAYSKISLNNQIMTDDLDIASTADLVKDTDIEIEDRYETFEVMDLISTYIDELPMKERLVFTLYYGEKLTLKRIGEVLTVTESRVCQIHGKALKLLYERCLD